MEAEDNVHQTEIIIRHFRIHDMKQDVGLGMIFSNCVMYFIILTTGTVLFNAGIYHIETVEQAAIALEPLAGTLSYLLFAIGIIGTGFLSIPVLSGCLSYMLSASFDWDAGLDNQFYQAKPFYLVIMMSLLLGLSIQFLGISPINVLLYTAILYGLTAPVLIFLILHMSNNKKIMGNYTNTILSNILGTIAFILMLCSAMGLIYLLFVGD
jgi:Mn2+/Fe2+ NRAMP family transporter